MIRFDCSLVEFSILNVVKTFIRNKRPWASYISVYLSIGVIADLNLLRSKIMQMNFYGIPGSRDPGHVNPESRD